MPTPDASALEAAIDSLPDEVVADARSRAEEKADASLAAAQHAVDSGIDLSEGLNIIVHTTEDGEVQYKVLSASDEPVGFDQAEGEVRQVSSPAERLDEVLPYFGLASCSMEEIKRVWVDFDHRRRRLTESELDLQHRTTVLLGAAQKLRGHERIDDAPPRLRAEIDRCLDSMPEEAKAELVKLAPYLRNRIRDARQRSRPETGSLAMLDRMLSRPGGHDRDLRNDFLPIITTTHQRSPRRQRVVSRSAGGGSSGDDPPGDSDEPALGRYPASPHRTATL